MEYNLLVRDKIPEIIRRNGERPVIHIAGEEEYWDRLGDKLVEEVKKFLKNQKDEEMGDIFEMLTTINKIKGWSIEQILEIQKKKREERGGFDKRIILERVDKNE